MSELEITREAAVFCLDGKIIAAGPRSDVMRSCKAYWGEITVQRHDCQAGVVVPGFCDSHTHPAFLLPRLMDFEKRIAGASYQEIAEAGGGIRSSISAVREASQAELEEHIEFALRQMVLQGTTTVEAKSGYGLSTEAELKSLRAIRDVANRWSGMVYSTFLGAHVVPPEYVDRREEYVETICQEMLPQVAAEQLAEFVDVFCERGAFSEDETEAIFAAAKVHGLGVRAHVGQFTATDLARFGRFHPASFDHLDHVDAPGLAWLSAHNTVATLMPGANFFLGHTSYPEARRMIDAGVPVGLATDYNPGTSPVVSMPFVMSLACTQMKMTPAEALVAATINGANALRCADRKGSIQQGKDADLAVFAVDDYREIAYWVAADLCTATIVGGELIA
jgi:imidazolonepropionase